MFEIGGNRQRDIPAGDVSLLLTLWQSKSVYYSDSLVAGRRTTIEPALPAVSSLAPY